MPDPSAERYATPLPEDIAAVLAAASEWWCERTLHDWDEAALARAVTRLEGDWLGCPECNHAECDMPCVPATVDEQLRSIDNHIAQLVHDGKLVAYVGYKPPDGWQPMLLPKSRKERQTDVLRAVMLDILNGVKAWRDCEGNDGFPHELRERIDAVVLATEAGYLSLPATAYAKAHADEIRRLQTEVGNLKAAAIATAHDRAVALRQAAKHQVPPEGFYPEGIAHLQPTIRVACITLDGTTLTVPADQLAALGLGDEDASVYSLTFKTMPRRDYDALGEFNGF